MTQTPASETPEPYAFVPAGPEPFGGAPGPQPYPGMTRRTITFAVSLVGATVLLALMAVLPAPYAVRGPGPTEDTLGESNGTPLITITGAETYESTGQLRLTTVSVAGGPGFPVNLGQVLKGWFDDTRSVRPVEETFPRDQTQEQAAQLSQQEMLSSQENATVAALTELGYEVPAVLTVAGTQPKSGADGVVADGDVITAIDGTAVPTYQDLVDQLAKVTPGDAATVTVERDGQSTDLTVTTSDGGGGRAVLGVLIDPTFDYPVDVTIQIDNIGGPSAGTMFALGIIDKMTPEDEANGQVIAGTGTMDVAGVVGPIGGIEQKMVAAKRDGATWFLAPASNCAEVVGHVPDGLHVVRISTLHEAREAVTAIGKGSGDTLPTCS